MTLPAFVVIGAQKSASTYLQDQISLHPDVEMAEGEVRFFEDPYYSDGAAETLESLFVGPPSKVRGIKRPDYLGRPEIPERLSRHLPEAKLLVVLREPVARAVSSYFHMVRHGFVPLRPVDEAFAMLLTDAWGEAYPRARDILTYGRYGEHLTRYLKYYPAEQIMVLDQSQVTMQPKESLRRAFAFLGVDPEFPLPERGNRVSNRGVYSPARLRLLRSKNRFRYSYGEDLARREPRRMTPWGWVYNTGIVGFDRIILSRALPGRPPELSPAVRSKVADYYSADREQLRRRLSQWEVDVPWL